MKTKLLTIVLAIFYFQSFAQTLNESQRFWDYSDTLNKKKLFGVTGVQAGIIAVTWIALNEAWYVDYPRQSFHVYNDNAGWLHMDKFGHAMSSYYIGFSSMEFYRWAGVDHRKRLLVGAPMGLIYLTGIEIMDGHSEGWGFSWGDMLANTTGSVILIGQELLWKEQKMVLKVSSHLSPYANYRPDLMGSVWYERLLKDYNGQTYWLSMNVNSLTGWDKWPEWLNLAVGYGADGMISSNYNKKIYENSDSFKWQKQYYVALDLDLRKLPVKSPFLKGVFNLINFIKVPMPTIEFNQKGSPNYHILYF